MSSEHVDLHTHSTASDGTDSPAELVWLAKRARLVGLALTDHDTVGGCEEAAAEAQRAGIRFIPGIEISCVYGPPGTMHLLGYCIEQGPVLAGMNRKLREARDARNPKIVAKLREMGVSITMDEVLAEANGAVVGRPHIASILTRKGYVSSIKQAFDKYLGQDAPAYFDKERLPARRAIELIHESGGLVVLAHPVQLRTENDAQLERVVKDLLDFGLDGIEVLHSDHDAAHVWQYTRLADRFGLLKTGGSDYHGHNKSIELGVANGTRIGREFMDALLARAETKRPSPSPGTPGKGRDEGFAQAARNDEPRL